MLRQHASAQAQAPHTWRLLEVNVGATPPPHEQRASDAAPYRLQQQRLHGPLTKLHVNGFAWGTARFRIMVMTTATPTTGYHADGNPSYVPCSPQQTEDAARYELVDTTGQRQAVMHEPAAATHGKDTELAQQRHVETVG